MVHTKQVHHRRVQIVDLERIFDRVVAKIVRRAVDRPWFGSAARHPDGETMWIVIASVAALGKRGASKLSGKDHQGLVQQPPDFQVFQQGGNGLIDRPRVVVVACFEV